MTQAMDSTDFMNAMMDLDGNPDQQIVVDRPQFGHTVDADGGVWTVNGDFVGQLPGDVFAHRTQVASGL